jgi:hypothetical protein
MSLYLFIVEDANSGVSIASLPSSLVSKALGLRMSGKLNAAPKLPAAAEGATLWALR